MPSTLFGYLHQNRELYLIYRDLVIQSISQTTLHLLICGDWTSCPTTPPTAEGVQFTFRSWLYFRCGDLLATRTTSALLLPHQQAITQFAENLGDWGAVFSPCGNLQKRHLYANISSLDINLCTPIESNPPHPFSFLRLHALTVRCEIDDGTFLLEELSMWNQELHLRELRVLIWSQVNDSSLFTSCNFWEGDFTQMLQSFVSLQVFGFKHPGVFFQDTVERYLTFTYEDEDKPATMEPREPEFDDISNTEWEHAERTFLCRLGGTVTTVFLAYGDDEICNISTACRMKDRMSGRLSTWKREHEDWILYHDDDESFGDAPFWDPEYPMDFLYGREEDGILSKINRYKPSVN